MIFMPSTLSDKKADPKVVAVVAVAVFFVSVATAFGWTNPTVNPATVQYFLSSGTTPGGQPAVGVNTYSFTDLLNIAGGLFQGIRVGANEVAPGVSFGPPANRVVSVAVAGRYLYVGIDDGDVNDNFKIYDISNPTAPSAQLNPVINGLGRVRDMAVGARYAYLAIQSGPVNLVRFDISNPTNPVRTTPDVTGSFHTVTVAGRYAYASVTGSFYPLDLNWDPATPVISPPSFLIPSPSCTTSGSIRDIYVAGQYAYVIVDDPTAHRLSLVDISNPTAISQPPCNRSIVLPARPRSLWVVDRYAYVALDGSQLAIVDVHNPNAMTLVSAFSLGNSGYNSMAVAISGKYAYVVDTNGTSTEIGTNTELVIIDVSNPSLPVIVSEASQFPALSFSGDSRSIAVSGRYAYIGATSGIHIIDLANVEAVSLEAHSLEAGSLQVRSDATFASHLSVRGSLTVGGNMVVYGNLSKSASTFLIDHPLDPQRQTLSHATVESPERLNLYDGITVLDKNGEAVAALPPYFEALNRGTGNPRSFTYLLTPIGAPAPGLYIKKEIAGNQFVIAGGAPGLRVSWQVTGVRDDTWAREHPLIVEKRKASGAQ